MDSSRAISQKGFMDILTLVRSTPDPSALTLTYTKEIGKLMALWIENLDGIIDDSFNSN